MEGLFFVSTNIEFLYVNWIIASFFIEIKSEERNV